MSVIFGMTLRQLIRTPLLWWLFAGVMVLSEFAPSFAEVVSFGNVEQTILDCAQATAWAGILMSVVLSTHMILGKEIDEKVAMSLFVKPLSTSSFLFGKFLALLCASTLIFVIQSLMIARLGWVYNWSNQGFVMFFSSMLMVFLQGMMLLSISVFMNCWLGNVISIWAIVIFWMSSLFIPTNWCTFLYPIFPMWTWFDLSEVIYKKWPIPWSNLIWLGSYAITYTILVILMSSQVLKRRQY